MGSGGRSIANARGVSAAIFLLLTAGSSPAQDATVDLGPSGVALPVPSVKLVEAGPNETGARRSFFGRIAARETVDLSFEVGGHMVGLPVTEGRPVVAGEVVARLEQGPFERAVERAAVALAQAERVVERTERLAAQNVGSEVQAEDARTARDLAAVALRDAEAALDDATLVAPFAGLVAARLTPQWSNVAPGQPILRLHDLSEVRVEIDVPERLFVSGDPEEVAWTGTLPQVDGPITLRLAEFDAQTGSVGQTFRVSLALPAMNLPTLIPGASMTVVAAAADPAASGVPLPATALLPGADRGARVMVYEPAGEGEGRVRAVAVEVASDGGTDLRVTGLPVGAQVVAIGGHLLSDGQAVRPYRGLSVEE